MIDLHCHLLPGIDDGPGDLDAALEQARRHVASGVETVVCTPHVSQSYANTAADIAERTAAFSQALADAEIPLRVLPGAEVSLSRAVGLTDDELTALHLGGSPWLLLEPPLGSDVPRLDQMVQSLAARGHRILIAHPERCAGFHHDDDLLRKLVDGGALAQVTAGSIAGDFGRTVARLARQMVDRGLVHVVSSDAHDSDRRPPGLAAPLRDAKLDHLVAPMTEEIPSALLSGGTIPPLPASGSGRRRVWPFGK